MGMAVSSRRRLRQRRRCRRRPRRHRLPPLHQGADVIHGVLTPTGAIRARWAVLMVLATAVLLVIGNVAYTGYVQHRADVRQEQARRDFEQRQEQARREAERRWCPLLATLDQPDVPATTPRGRVVQEQIHA